MREPGGKRLVYASLFALAAATILTIGNPINRIKADLRADAKGFVFSLEYSARVFGF